MKNLSTWLLVCFMTMFLGFRVVVTFLYEFKIDFMGIVPLNSQYEIVLLFITLLCILLIVKRKMIGALVYLLSYGMYFGIDAFSKISILIEKGTIPLGESLATIISIIGIILPIIVMIDLLVDKGRKAHPVDKKTDWFYKNKEFDRKLDDRSDKNNYRTM